MNNYSKLSLAQIDADALSDYVVAKKKLVYREGDESVTASNLAQDTEKVANVLADNIAVCVPAKGRNTVQNAMNVLDNLGIAHPFTDFMTAQGGASLQTKYLRTRQQYGDELQNLMDELYTLRQELARHGFIEDRGEYTGYIDTFRKNMPKHISEMLTVVSPAGEANQIFVDDVSVFAALNIYDYIVLQSSTVQKFVIRQIAEKDEENRVLTLSDVVPNDILMDNEGIELYLSYGINDEGMFKFAKEAELAMGDENHTGLSDDTFRVMKHTANFTPNTGFGYSFRIPREKQGFVTSFEICAKAYGNPGSMVCYLLDARDVDNFHNPVQAANDYAVAKENNDDSFHFFAASKPYVLSSSYGRRYIKFDFLQEDETYPLMTQDEEDAVRYVAVIEFLDCDRNNYYDIQFLQHKNSEGHLGDLELNNTTYIYTRQADGSTKKALATNDDINTFDMYYHIVTRSIIEREVDPVKEGLYSFHVQTKEMVHKARVMLRIRKEGAYAVNTDGETQRVYIGDPILLQNTDANNGIKSITELCVDKQIYQPLELRQTESQISVPVPIVLGNNIATFAGKSETALTVNEPVLLKNGDPVYRAGYHVCLKARKTEFVNGQVVHSAYKHFVLPFTEVFKDFRTMDKTTSARLLFETNLYRTEADAEDYNDFIVQIYWSNPDMNTGYKDVKKAQMGAIKDISVSFNQGY